MCIRDRVSFVTERYLLSGVPLPVISAVFILAACLGMGNEVQRRGRLAELAFPWVLVLLVLLLVFAAFHLHQPDFSLMEPWSAETITEGAYQYFTMGTSVSLVAFILVRVDKGSKMCIRDRAIPFSGEVECAGCTSDMIPNIEVTMIQNTMEIAPDADGEERMLQMDVVLELDLKLYQETVSELLQDVYTPKKQAVLVSSPKTVSYTHLIYVAIICFLIV